MTDIPVGSPPVPPGRHAAPGGWYPDPTDAQKERYWDGWQWSKNTRDAVAAAGGQSGAGQPPAAPYGQGQYGQGHYGQDQYGQDQYGQGQQGQGHFPPGQYPPGQQLPQDPYAQPSNPQGQYPQGQYPQGQYAQGQYAQGQYAQGQYAQGQYSPAYGGNVPGQRAIATADGVRLAGWWLRLLAVLLDSIFVSLLAAIPSLGIYARVARRFASFYRETVTATQNGAPAPPTPTLRDLISASDQLARVLILVAVTLAYHLLFVRLKSATPGKMICGLRIVPVDQGHFSGRLSWRTVLIRVGVWVLPSVNAYLSLIRLLDGLWPLWQPKRQALHDLAARTQVIKKS